MRVLVTLIIGLAVLMPASAQAATVPDQLSLAAKQGKISWTEREQALLDYRKLAKQPDRDFIFQRKQIVNLARKGRLAPRAAQATASLRAFGKVGDKANGTRVELGAITVQRVPGAGWQVHPLASAGRLNAWAGSSKANPDKLATAGKDLARIAVANHQRYEYLFPWLGARPGWISAMPQAIIASAYARIYKQTGNKYFRRLALAALRPVMMAPPKGTTLSLSTGRHGLLYPFRPRFRVANAQLWTTLAVDEVGETTKSLAVQRLGQSLVEQSLHELPKYADGKKKGWTVYAIGSDKLSGRRASANYHYLLVQALRRLCARGRDQFCRWAKRYGQDVPKVYRAYLSYQ